MSFAERQITVTINLARGSFAGTDNANTVKLTGYRTAVQILKAGGFSMPEAQVQIYGLDLGVMNQLSTLGRTPIQIDTRNQITIEAGDAGQQPSTVFIGTISEAIVDLSGSPDSILHVSAFSGLGEAITTVPPASYPSAVDVSQVLKGMASQSLAPGGLSFESNDVSVMLSSPYFPGSLRSQIQKTCTAADVNWIIDNGALAVWPKNGFRSSQQTPPTISKATGMIGYPFPSGQGLVGVRSEFNNQIGYGSQIKIQSVITPANGPWTVCYVEHDISALVPDGPWMTIFKGNQTGLRTQ